MKTIVNLSNILTESWSDDLTPSATAKQQYLYIQCLGHYVTTPDYLIANRGKLHSFLLIYTRSGMGILEYKNRITLLTPGSLVLINCEHNHSYYNNGPEFWDFEWIHFCGSCIDGYLSEISKYWDRVEIDCAESAFQEIQQHANYSLPENDLICSTLLIRLCSEYLLELKRSIGNSDSELYPFIKNAMDYIQENFSQEITLDSLCQTLNISKSYLGHTFKQQLGSSPYEYLVNTRLAFSKSLLRNTGQTIAEIAESCGFYSSSYFIQTFKKHESMTPLQYRRHFLQLENSQIPYQTT